MMLMDKLDAAAKNGASVDIHWYYDTEDDTMQELGEEFATGKRYEELLKDYQKLFRVTRRLMRLSDRNEQQLNALSAE